jgi:hypothetical protein
MSKRVRVAGLGFVMAALLCVLLGADKPSPLAVAASLDDERGIAPNASRLESKPTVSATVDPPAAPVAQAAADATAVPSAYPTLRVIPPDTPGAHFLKSLGPVSESSPSAGELLLMKTTSPAYLEPMNWGVTIYKSAHLLIVYYEGRRFRSYNAVFGRSPFRGAKLWDGDLRTPQGVYWIIHKHPSIRWHHFLALNYPNEVDELRYAAMAAAGYVPAVDGQAKGEGGAIGIHGTDHWAFNRLKINWTSGCISVDNNVIDDLDTMLPVRTLVIIQP